MSAAAAPSRRNAAIAVLFCALVLCYADRQLPFLLLEPIKHGLALSDTEVSLLTGTSFALALALCSLPLSWIADRSDRARLIAVCITVWSAATLGGGIATGFWMLFVLRMGVGVGEAGLTPTGYSLLADLYQPRELARPMAVLAFGSMLGSVAALNGGGAFYELVRGAAERGALPLEPANAWRAVLATFGALGVLLGVVAWFAMPEPRRTGARGAAATTPGDTAGLVAFARGSGFFYAPYVGAMCLYCLFSAGTSAWMAPFFARSYGWSVGATGQALGSVALATGLLGLPLGVWLHRALGRRTGRESAVTTIWVTLACTAPFVVLMPLAPSAEWALAAYFLVQLPASAATVIAPIVYASTAPAHLRARVVAVSTLCYGLLGTALGPTLYALFTDYVLHDPARLATSLCVVSGALTALLLPLLVLADRRYDAARALARGESPADATDSDAVLRTATS